VVRQQVNELMIRKLVNTYCLPRLLYGSEIWPTETLNMHELEVIWNNGFRYIFNCCWRDSVKPLQFFCYSLPLSYLIDERQLMFFSKMHHTDNPILRTLIYLATVKYEIMGLAAKCGLNGVQCGVSVIKEAVLLCFKQNVQF